MVSPTDPLFTLQTTSSGGSKTSSSSDGSAVIGVCFVSDQTQKSRSNIDSGDDDSSSDGESDSDNDDDLNFRCSNILLGSQHQQHSLRLASAAAAVHSAASSYSNLRGYKIVSCHHDGSCKIWDLSTRRCIVDDINNRLGEKPRKFGLAVRRLDGNNGVGASPNQFLYQTRDACGTVTLHDLCHDPSVELMRIETNSTTFCTMSPCRVGRQAPGGEQNLIALPTEYHSMAVVRDWRCDPKAQPAFRISTGHDNDSMGNGYNYYGRDNKYGMLMSLGLALQHDSQNLVLGCGMEDGSILFYDLGASGNGRRPWYLKQSDFAEIDLVEEKASNQHSKSPECGVKLGKEPVLSLDLATSYCDHTRHASTSSSLVAVAGCAGDADELSDLSEKDRGTVSTLKVSLANSNCCDSKMKATIRTKTQTCSYSSEGKVGVSVARFRDDGRIFAVGGWDRRLRIFGRTSSKPLAVLHGGHEDSIVAIDWAQDSAVSGLLATGAGDGKICVYRVFPHTLVDKET
jgi:WD40 repeat protein